MPPTDYHGSYIGRSIMNLRRDMGAHAAEPAVVHEATGLELELDAFQRQVTDRFVQLSSTGADELLSLSWIQKLLDVFLSCQEDFRAILFSNRALVGKSPVDRLIADFNDRSVKALDVCNAIRDGIDQIRQWQKLLEIVLYALESKRNVGEGQVRRAKKALIDLAISMIDEKDSGSSSSTVAHRNRSFSQHSNSSSSKPVGHFRSLSWSVSRSWSAARQIQAIGNNLYAPKGSEIVATNGLAVAAYTMNSVLLFVMWVLVAAIPCQDRGLHLHLSIPRQFTWASSLLGLHDRIVDESKKREKKNVCGLLKEISVMERIGRTMMEVLDSVQFPIDEEKDGEVRKIVEELGHVFEDVKEGLEPLERHVREVFHRIIRVRSEGSDCSLP